MKRNIFDILNNLTDLPEDKSEDENDNVSICDSESELETYSDDDSDYYMLQENDDQQIGKDGTRWKACIQCKSAKREYARNVFTAKCGPSATAKRRISSDEKAISAFSLLFDETMMRKIQVQSLFLLSSIFLY